MLSATIAVMGGSMPCVDTSAEREPTRECPAIAMPFGGCAVTIATYASRYRIDHVRTE